MTTPSADIRLAVIDDHPIVVAGLQAMFANQDGVSLAGTAASAREFQEAWPSGYDVILLDLSIPGESYTDNIANLISRYPSAKLVAYTAYDTPDLIKETLELGCVGYLRKNISREELMRGIRAVQRGEIFVGTNAQQARSARAARTASEASKGSGIKDEFQKRLLLSKREKEILHHISKGETSQQIADALYISRYTVETHRKNILRKLNFNTSTELVKFAVLQGLV